MSGTGTYHSGISNVDSFRTRVSAGIRGDNSETKRMREELGLAYDNEDKIEAWKIERLRYKCLITIMSLIEQLDTQD